MASFYIIQQLLSILILFKLRKLYAAISLFFFIIIFLFKPDTFDMFMYPDIVKQTHNYEFLFGKVISLISLFIDNERKVITIYQIIFLIFSTSILLFFLDSQNKLLTLAIIFSSVAIMVGVHNNLRQGTASIFILLGILSYISGYKKTGIILTLSSHGFHESAIFFIILIFFTYLLFSEFYKKFSLKNNLECMLRIYVLASTLALITALILVNLIDFIDKITFGTTVFVNYMRFFEYGEFRTNLTLKTILLLILILATEFFMRFRSINFKVDLLRFLRIYFLLFCLFISFFPNFSEIGNRILYIYYVFELGMLCFLVSLKYFNTVTVNLLAYIFAFNVWNIIGGI